MSSSSCVDLEKQQHLTTSSSFPSLLSAGSVDKDVPGSPARPEQVDGAMLPPIYAKVFKVCQLLLKYSAN